MTASVQTADRPDHRIQPHDRTLLAFAGLAGNTASVLPPVSNLANLLALQRENFLSLTFAARMALTPTAGDWS